MARFAGLRQRLLPALPTQSIAGLAWLLALAGSAWLLADLAWRRLAPAPVAFARPLASDTGEVAAALSSRHLMGEAAAGGGSAAPTRFALSGVFTGDAPRPGFAVLAVDGAPAQGVVLGQEVAPGVVLARLLPDRVELRGADGTQTVPLAAAAKPAATPPAVPVEH